MYGEPIKIQLGKIFMNRTRKYLFPVIKSYGSDFAFKINSLFKVAVGIGDIIVDRCGIHHEHHLFILVDTLVNSSQFISLLDDIRRHISYEDDYVYGGIMKSRLHMIVVKIPEQYLTSFANFKKSRYSQMYKEDDLKKLFDFDNKGATEEYKTIKKILIRDHNYKFEFAKIITKEFGELISGYDISNESELDLQILEREEIFNVENHECNE